MSDVKLRREQLLRMLDGYPVQVQTPGGSYVFTADVDTTWEPVTQEPIPEHLVRMHKRAGQDPPHELWTSSEYEVFVYYRDPELKSTARDGMLHLSIKRYDRLPIRSWRHLQQIKDEVAGDFREALELFPGEHRIADNANQYHLHVLPVGVQIPVGYSSGMVLVDDEDVETFNQNGDPGRQEPRQPGLTMGDGMNEAQKAMLSGDGETEELRQRILGGMLSRGHGQGRRRGPRA